MRIGEVAKLTGLSADTIRFYEERGLLVSPARTEGGFRVFSQEHVDTLLFIRDSQRLGLSLTQIHELLALRAAGPGACESVRRVLRRKLSEVRTKVAGLRRLESVLLSTLRRCEHKVSRTCPILERRPRGQNRKQA